MLRPLLVAAMVAAACSAAEDQVVLRDGTVLFGEVVSEDAHHVVVMVERKLRVTLDRSQVKAVELYEARQANASGPRRERPTGEQTRSSQPLPDESRPWTLSLLLAGGLDSGSLTSSGTLVNSSTSTNYRIEGDYAFGGVQALPGAAVRLTHDDAEGAGSGLRLGLQFSDGSASADIATLMATSISALVGWAWTSPTRRHAIQGLVGWDQADLSRDLILKDGAGATLAQISDKTNLEGYSLAVEAETAWLWDSWTLGVHTGATWRSLSGDATWSSGNYHGKESFDGSLLSLYVGGSVGLRF